MTHSSHSGAGYFFKGLGLITLPGIRRFVILPLLVNFILMAGFIMAVFSRLDSWITDWLSYLPSWLAWLSYLLWPLLAGAIIMLCSYFFSTIANWIAAPFNGLLAEHLEARLTGNRAPDQGLIDIVKDLPRILAREWSKLCYFLPRALGLLLLMWVPLIGQTIGPLLWFVFTAWMLSIQYCDYPFDNHRIHFVTMRENLGQHKALSLSFGLIVMLFTMVPILNLLVMPAAVCGATAMWVDNYRPKLTNY